MLTNGVVLANSASLQPERFQTAHLQGSFSGNATHFRSHFKALLAVAGLMLAALGYQKVRHAGSPVPPCVKPGAMQLLIRQRLRRLPCEALAQSCCGTLSAMLIQIPWMLATPSVIIFSEIAR